MEERKALKKQLFIARIYFCKFRRDIREYCEIFWMQNLLWAKSFLTLKYWDQRNFFTDFTGTSTKETDPQNAYGNICNIGTNILFLQFCGQGPRLDFQSGGAKNIVTKEAQAWFAPTGKFSIFSPQNCLKMTLFQTEFDQS